MVLKKLLLILTVCTIARADTGFKNTIQVTETDNSPKCQAGQIKVSAGTLTCNGQTATITTGGGTGGSPGGTGTQIQYNNAGSFGGVPGSTVTATGPILSSGTIKEFNTSTVYGNGTLALGHDSQFSDMTLTNSGNISKLGSLSGLAHFGEDDNTFLGLMDVCGADQNSGVYCSGFYGGGNQCVTGTTTHWKLPCASASGFLKDDGSGNLSIATPAGGSGYAVDPATVTFKLNLGATASTFTIIQSGIGVTLSTGIALTNTSAAAAGAQQASPALEFSGSGWKTNATASSQTVKWDVFNIPIQAGALPTNELHFLPNVNAVNQIAIDMCGIGTGGTSTMLEFDGQGCGGGTGLGPVNASSEFGIFTNLTERILFGNSGMNLANGNKIGWQSGALGNSFTPDTVLSRNGVGSLEVDTSTLAGTYGKLTTSTQTFYGPIVSSGTAPTVSSCGATPNGSVSGTNTAGVITVGGGVVTSCTLTFANGGFAVDSTVVCVVTDNSTTVSASNGTINTTSAVFNTSATLGGGLIYYVCIAARI